FATLPLLAWWTGLPGWVPVAALMFAGLPVVLISKVPQALMERKLNYKHVATIGMVSQIAYQPVAIGLAWWGAGAYAPAAGWWTSTLICVVMNFILSGYRPKLLWRTAHAKEMMTYGISFASSAWVWQARLLINPLIIGHMAGADAVGYVALALRLMGILRFAQNATWRLSIVALAKVQDDLQKMTRVVSEGTRLQVLMRAPLFAGFGIAAPLVLPPLMGDRWEQSTVIFPFVAAGALANSLFSLQSSALYALRHNWDVTLFNASYVIVFAVATAILSANPEIGVMGYAWAELIAISSYAVIHARFVRRVGRPEYSLAVLWSVGLALLMFWPWLGWFSLGGLVAIVAYPVMAVSATLPVGWRSQLSHSQAASVLNGLLNNVYRAFEFREESDIYDKLALSVTGDELTDIYLDSRRALEVENQGGARARVEQVDVTRVEGIRSTNNGSIVLQAQWQVGGSVSHFGHTHFRHNQYEALIELAIEDDVWKIVDLEVVDEHRLL
ncbi:MAG: oligosaccharide flippase family protein, partial [Cyanobacteria bacterium P01_E01_bin.48]